MSTITCEEKIVEIADRFYLARRVLIGVLGEEKYQTRVEEYVLYIEALVRTKKISHVEAAHEIIDECLKSQGPTDATAVFVNWILAAAVEAAERQAING